MVIISWCVKLVKLVDKICNLCDIVWYLFVDWLFECK